MEVFAAVILAILHDYSVARNSETLFVTKRRSEVLNKPSRLGREKLPDTYGGGERGNLCCPHSTVQSLTNNPLPEATFNGKGQTKQFPRISG